LKIANTILRAAVWTVLLSVTLAQAASDATIKELWQRAEQGEKLTPAEKADLAPYLLETERHHPQTIDAVGGPDGYGYYYMDNQNGDTTTYSWIELRGDNQATWINFENGDDDAFMIPLSFEFPYYGLHYRSVSVSTNGFITFVENRFASMNQCLPAASLGGASIAAFWDDLTFLDNQTNNTVAYRDFGDYIVIQYDQIGHYGFPTPPADNYTFECILYANGSIKLQYQEMNYVDFPSSQTVGLQQQTTGTSLQYVCNGGNPANGTAVWFYRSGYGILSGHVTSGGQPIYQATVLIEDEGLYASTDGSGSFYYPVAPVGTFEVSARMFGYTPMTINNVEILTNQQTTQNFAMTSIPVTSFSEENVELAIPDRDTVVAELYVDDNVGIQTMAVRISDLSHTYVGDLMIWLESPWGQRVLLSGRNGGSGDNMLNCQFDDQSGQSIADGIAPFSGRYWSEEPLSSFSGNPCRGTWKLVLFDAANQDRGTLHDWSLHFTGSQIPEGHVWGYVTDNADAPVAGCDVWYAQTDIHTTTDENGMWNMWLPVGTWNLEFTADDLCGYTEFGISVTDGSNQQIDVEMGTPHGFTETESLLQEVVGGGIFTQEFTLESDGACNWTYDIEVIAGNWLTVSPSQGLIAAGNSADIVVTFNTNGLQFGVYTGELEISHNGMDGRITIPVTLDLATPADPGRTLPNEFALHGNYPNPFNGYTDIAFDLPVAGPVNIAVYNLLGQQVATLLNDTRAAGFHKINWNARSDQGQELTTGLYFLRVNMGGRNFVSKMVLAR
jgi:subtilisin-like proprotein convertase family protein